MKSMIKNPQLLKLGGITGILTGISILTFAISSELNGVFFVPEIYNGGSIEYWIENLGANSTFASIHIFLMVLGFFSMLVTAFILYQIIPENSWQKNLSIISYAIGGAIIFPTIASHQSLENYIITLLDKGEYTSNQIQEIVGSEVHTWMTINDYFGLLFIIILGTGLMSWALRKAGIIPKWFFIWAIVVSVLVTLSFFKGIFPVFAHFGNFAPLHMIWFSILGIILLRLSKIKLNTTANNA
jgi:hypothetical protein